jgi:hypothetical protein
MNNDIPAFSAFALESYHSTGQSAGDSQTLTMQLAIEPLPSSFEPMGGSATTHPVTARRGNLLSAAVLPADGPVLTITF